MANVGYALSMYKVCLAPFFTSGGGLKPLMCGALATSHIFGLAVSLRFTKSKQAHFRQLAAFL